MMLKIFIKSLPAVFAVFLYVLTGSSGAHAYTNSHLMDDGVFDNVNSMSEQQIRDFINSRPSSCLATSGAIFPEPITYFQYGVNVDAARVIYNAAQYSGLNPQVILATLQKEQTLISRTNCYEHPSGIDSRNKAMGQGCPDSGPCPAPAYAGFHQQVMKGAWQLKFNEERANGNTEWGDNGSISYGGPWTPGNRKACTTCADVYRDGYWVIDGQTVLMETGATASLYRYTPHLGQAFPGIFEGWFGSVYFHGNDPLGNFEIAQPASGGVRVAGWAFDRGSGVPATVDTYIDGAYAGSATADAYRPDVGAAFASLNVGNNRGYDKVLPYTQSGTHQVCSWVIGDHVGAATYGLGCKTVTLNFDPLGNFEIAQPASGGVRVAGWAFDRGSGVPATVDTYIDGAYAGSATADAYRPDVGAAFANLNVGNNRGYDKVLTYTKSGTHQVCSWVIGDNVGAATYGLGCKTVVIN